MLHTLWTVNDYTRVDDFAGAAIILESLGEPDAPAACLSQPGAEYVVDIAMLNALAASS